MDTVSMLNNMRFYCQPILPLVYDESMSYYETLCKVVGQLNTTGDAVNKLNEGLTGEIADRQTADALLDERLKVLEATNKKIHFLAFAGTPPHSAGLIGTAPTRSELRQWVNNHDLIITLLETTDEERNVVYAASCTYNAGNWADETSDDFNILVPIHTSYDADKDHAISQKVAKITIPPSSQTSLDAPWGLQFIEINTPSTSADGVVNFAANIFQDGHMECNLTPFEFMNLYAPTWANRNLCVAVNAKLFYDGYTRTSSIATLNSSNHIIRIAFERDHGVFENNGVWQVNKEIDYIIGDVSHNTWTHETIGSKTLDFSRYEGFQFTRGENNVITANDESTPNAVYAQYHSDTSGKLYQNLPVRLIDTVDNAEYWNGVFGIKDDKHMTFTFVVSNYTTAPGKMLVRVIEISADVNTTEWKYSKKEFELPFALDTAMSDTSTNAVQNKVIKKYVDDHSAALVDTAMSDTSTNAVQNKVIKKYVDDHSATNAVLYTAQTLTFEQKQRARKNIEAADSVWPTITGGVSLCPENVTDSNDAAHAKTTRTSADDYTLTLDGGPENALVRVKGIRTPTDTDTNAAANVEYVKAKITYVNADYQARFDGKFLQIAYSYVAGGGATNSKEHYEHCAKNDYDAVKADLRLTSDNQLVCCHDAGITLNADGRIVSYDSSNSTAIHEMTKAQFMALEFNTMYDGVRCHTCDLETVLQICKNAGKIAYITIRGEYVEATVAALVAAVQDAGMVSHTIINSFTMDALTAVRAAEPDLYLSLVIDPFTESERTAALTYAQGKKTCQICLYYNNGSHTLAEMVADSTITEWISSCIAAGIRLIGAQADAAADTNTLLKLGFCGVQTRVSRLTNASYDGLDISTLNVATTSTDDATTLTLSDEKGNQKTAEIPKLQPTDAQVQAGVASWMDANAKPTVVWSKNLYNPDETVNGYIANSGQINGSTDYWTTGFIPVSPGDVLTISKAGARINCYYRAAYTSNKTFISRETGNANTYTVPDNAAYVRLSFKNAVASKTDEVMVCANNTDLTYEAYGSHTEGGLGEYLVLVSANGKKWTLNVSDTGELSTQEIT